SWRREWRSPASCGEDLELLSLGICFATSDGDDRVSGLGLPTPARSGSFGKPPILRRASTPRTRARRHWETRCALLPRRARSSEGRADADARTKSPTRRDRWAASGIPERTNPEARRAALRFGRRAAAS